MRPGENALFFAGHGHLMLGIDFLKCPIMKARRKAQERGLVAEFARMDVLKVTELDNKFRSVLDSGLFYVFFDEDWARYVVGLAEVTRPGGRLFLICFSDEELGTQGRSKTSPAKLRGTFPDGWDVGEVRPEPFKVAPTRRASRSARAG